MAFQPPVFNLICDLWNNGNTPLLGAADFPLVPCQLYVLSKPDAPRDSSGSIATLQQPVVVIRLPADNWPDNIDFAVVTDGIGSYTYAVHGSGPVHLGFPNQYFALYCQPADPATLAYIEKMGMSV